MSVAPASSTPRGEVALQPNYFTSSIYVNALKDDISTLVLKFYEAYSNDTSTPFKAFKSIWTKLGWHWLHFKVFDHRTRKTFLDVTLRLFLERTVKTEAPFTRVVALFGLHTFFFTQIESTAPPLYTVKNIPIPFDHRTNLMALPETLSTPHLLPLQPHVRFILKRLQTENKERAIH
ncbi:hypothetical protein BJ165DRAFT_531317 [Panaeolus papilionaceus]|nr:hypothetical protein BJ165DRAFT_531317 [Panaeolus papilionaceus]